jgi:pyruvate formate lyase activating enzyme
MTRYGELTGFGDLDRIAESIELLLGQATDYELRTTLIDPFHDDDQLLEIAGMVRGARRYVLQPFLPREDMPDPEFRELARTTPGRLREAKVLMEGCAEEILIRGE